MPFRHSKVLTSLKPFLFYKWVIGMAKIKIKKTKPYKLAYIEHVGDYRNVPFDKYIPQLYGWAKEKKVRPGFRSVGIYYDCPETTPPEKCRSEIGIPVHGTPEPGGEIKIKDVPVMEVAVIKHAGPAKDYSKTYGALNEWMTQSGYEWAGPAFEVYTKKPKVKGGETIIYAEVQVPVRKK